MFVMFWLLLAPLLVLKENQDSWKAIVIDEFQDTSAMQYSLLRILASHNHITIVGDDDQVCCLFTEFPLKEARACALSLSLWVHFHHSPQLFWSSITHLLLQSIFSFNGADISGFDSFRKDFPNYKEVCFIHDCFFMSFPIYYLLYIITFIDHIHIAYNF